MPPRDHAAARPPKPEPVIPLRVRTRQMVADLLATARLVWSASPRLLSLILVLSILLALVPAATLWVGKLLLDEVARAITRWISQLQKTRIAGLRRCSRCRSASPSPRRSCRRVYATSRELLGDTLQNRISLRILHKAAALDVESFENAETYDALRNAYNEVGSRPLGVMFQVIGIGQALDHADVDRRPDGAAGMGGAAARAAGQHSRRPRLEPLRRRRLSRDAAARDRRAASELSRIDPHVGQPGEGSPLVRLRALSARRLAGLLQEVSRAVRQPAGPAQRVGTRGHARIVAADCARHAVGASPRGERHHHRRRLFALRRRHRADSESVHRIAQRRHRHLREPALHAQPVRVSRAAVAQSRRRETRGADRSSRSSSSTSASGIR